MEAGKPNALAGRWSYRHGIGLGPPSMWKKLAEIHATLLALRARIESLQPFSLAERRQCPSGIRKSWRGALQAAPFPDFVDQRFRKPDARRCGGLESAAP